MGKTRIVALGLVVVTPLVVLLVGLVASLAFQIAVASLLLAMCVMAGAFLVMRQVGVANKRLSGLIKLTRQQEARLQRVERLVDARIDVNYTVPDEVRRAHEDLVLACRSLNVPQEHFDQLLRTIAANAARTESAIDELSDRIAERPR